MPTPSYPRNVKQKPFLSTRIHFQTTKHKAKYSLEYLKKMISGSKLADKVSLQFNTDYPLKIQYTVLDKLSMSFILAPRVDND